METLSYISNAHPSYIDNLYKEYQQDTKAVDHDWQKFFEGFEFALADASQNGHEASANGTPLADSNTLLGELKVYKLIQAYRNKAHLIADTNPIRKRKDRKPHLDLADFQLTEADLERSFYVGSELNLGKTTLSKIIARLREIYVNTIGIEYAYVNDPKARKWLQERFESRNGSYKFDIEKKKRILRKLNETGVFEEFLHKKFIGQKRFSLEGGESAIPALDAIINEAATQGVQEVVIGMAHRGRLNVLANIMGKTYKEIFAEFEGHSPKHHNMGDGDVKYHLGFSAQLDTPSGNNIYVQLAPNPSHLEAVDPVVQGFARAKADVIYNSDYDQILPILIHGDAAIAGQGLVYEVTQMSKLPGYNVGGMIHIVINNQIGFTTNFDDARSSHYCTSIASIVKAPVLHVNGDDVEAMVFVAELAADYRQEFNTDIFIDMVCYRKHGHNEADDPKYTQPGYYKALDKHPNPRKIYSDKLLSQKDVDDALVKNLEKEFNQLLQERLDDVRENPLPYKKQEPELAWQKMKVATRKDFDKSPVTGITKTKVSQIVEGMIKVPEGFTPLRKIQKYLDKRRESMKQNKTLDWAAAELMAYASILLEGNNVRMSGQDVKRGTFSHRHAMLYDEKTHQEYNRLNHYTDDQGKLLIYNSLLSEYAVLGFEFGYSLASPDTLTIWEAQFGDFANGAQIMIDQFITSSESKWQRSSSLVMLLPHGYDGLGPEHSSARLERFLQACAELNISVCNITEPANFFHALRRQQHRPFRKPLVVMSPKALLRHPRCVSSIFDIVGKTKFKEIIDDPFVENPKKVRKVILCTGKVYYELAAEQEKENIQDVAIVRIEQLYPITRKQLDAVLARYPKKAKLVWVQEEPANMGAWWHIMYRLRDLQPDFVARKTSASPATGYKSQHDAEQKDIIKRAFE